MQIYLKPRQILLWLISCIHAQQRQQHQKESSCKRPQPGLYQLKSINPLPDESFLVKSVPPTASGSADFIYLETNFIFPETFFLSHFLEITFLALITLTYQSFKMHALLQALLM